MSLPGKGSREGKIRHGRQGRKGGQASENCWQEQKQDLVVHLCSFVSLQGVLGSLLAVGARLELGQVAVIVALHLQVEHLTLARAGRGNQVLVKESQDAATYVAELVFHLQATIFLIP